MDVLTPTTIAPPPALTARLARPAHAEPRPLLDVLMGATVLQVRSEDPDLTQRQLAVLLLVHRTPGPHTVRGMAAALSASKPAITRALDLLSALDLLKRAADPEDRRSVLAVPTAAGAAFLHRLSLHLRLAAEGR
jgi:DNA-binding MarR family transcriptional regulator